MSTSHAGTVPTVHTEGPPPRLPRRRRWPWVVLAVVGVLVVAGVVLAPSLVGSVLRTKLLQTGVGAVDLGAIAVGLGSLEVRDIRLASATDAGSITIRRAMATFAVTDLLAGRIATLVLDEPVWTMVAGDARSPFGRATGGDDATAAAGASRAQRLLPALPIRELTVRGGKVVMAGGDGPDPVALDGVAVFGVSGWDVQMDARWRQRAAHATAKVQQEGERVLGTLHLATVGGAPFACTGSLELEVVAGAPVLTIALQKEPGPFEIAVPDGTWSGAGDVAFRASLPMADLTNATLAIDVAGLQLTSPTGARVEGIATKAQFVGLPVPVTTTPQRVTWQAVQSGSFAARGGHVEVALLADLRVDVKGVQQMGDGTGSIAVADLRWTPGAEEVAATITADDLSMREWLELLSGGKVTGEGRLDGSVALVVRLQPSVAVDLRSGHLTAAPGGVVRFLDKATAAALLQVDPRAAASKDPAAQTKDDLVAALAEFVYTALDFHVEPDAASSAVTLRVHARGSGKGMTRPIQMDVNIRGFDQAVDTALALEFGWQRMKDRMPRPHGATKTTPGKNQ